jgi:hypothetical protein
MVWEFLKEFSNLSKVEEMLAGQGIQSYIQSYIHSMEQKRKKHSLKTSWTALSSSFIQ